MISLRPAMVADSATLARLHVESWQAAYVGQLSQNYLDSLSVTERQARWQSFFDAPEREGTQVLLAFEGDRAVGFVSFGAARDASFPGWGEIYAIYLQPEVWGRGFGYALFKAAADVLKKQAYDRFYIWVLNTNHRAIGAYRRWGGVPDADTVKELTIGGTIVWEIIVRFEEVFSA